MLLDLDDDDAGLREKTAAAIWQSTSGTMPWSELPHLPNEGGTRGVYLRMAEAALLANDLISRPESISAEIARKADEILKLLVSSDAELEWLAAQYRDLCSWSYGWCPHVSATLEKLTSDIAYLRRVGPNMAQEVLDTVEKIKEER